MKNQKGFTIVELVILMGIVSILLAWIINGYKLTQCDFEAPYKGEAIHAIGLVGPLSLFTVWNDDK